VQCRWLLRRPSAQASWPRIGFGVALLVFCAARVLQLAVDLGNGCCANADDGGRVESIVGRLLFLTTH